MSPDPGPRVPDGYEPLRLLGRGSMGTVWLAPDRRLDRHVAIKTLDRATPAELGRFRQEALAAGRLRSRSIVKVHELDEHEGRPYLVMEYVDGGSLAERDLDVAPLLAVMREVAGALAHAHEQGIVHRDLKPANILLDAGGRAYVTDFGLARSAMATPDPGPDDEAIVGTPWFMSPEQARGQPGDARSDVFSFGVTF